ncbi:unnamed protein product [Mesocestoides corti]|nr:unnamed protein product [Mesocestoides corti]
MLFIGPSSEHQTHRIKSSLSKAMLSMPSYLLEPLEESSEHAQYFFSIEWLNFMLSTLHALRIDNVLCVGSPRLFDFLSACGKKTHKPLSVRKFLLDLDVRLASFYPPSLFARFNALNGYFFSPAEEESARTFMHSCNGNTLIFCDPPFGVFMEPLVETLNRLKEEIGCSNTFMMVTIPYFIGRKLIQVAPLMKMLDYKVTYENHVRFMSSGHDGNNSKRRVSVVRLFTDAPAHKIVPPKTIADDYWFCESCQRYSDIKNKHCNMCNACTTPHGETYVHCKPCGTCQPPSYQHCDVCNTCFRPQEGTFHECAEQTFTSHREPKRRKTYT